MADSGSASVSVISGTSVIANLPVGTSPIAIAVNGSGTAYVVSQSGNVTVISGTSDVATVPVGHEPSSAVWDSENGYVYVTNSITYRDQPGTVSVIAGTRVLANLTVGEGPSEIVYDAASGSIYVLNDNGAGSPTVSVISDLSVVSTISVGTTASAILPGCGTLPAAGDLYVTNGQPGTVTVVSGTQVIATVPVGVDPYPLICDPTTGEVYVGNYLSENVSVLAGTNVVATVPMVGSPVAFGYDPVDGRIYVATNQGTAGNQSLFEILGTTAVNVFPIGEEPSAVASSGGLVYVANSGSNDVSVIGSVAPPPPLALASFFASPAQVSVGGTTIFRASTTGGVGSLQVLLLRDSTGMWFSQPSQPFLPAGGLGPFCCGATGDRRVAPLGVREHFPHRSK